MDKDVKNCTLMKPSFSRFVLRSRRIQRPVPVRSTRLTTFVQSPMRYLLLVCFTLFALNVNAVEVLKGDIDDREYKYFELDNGLKALVIHDASTDKAAAALDVYVGSADNPDDRRGLAHFLEHMLFLGTEKYPQADEYQQFISQNGGSHNAYTSSEHTNYFFEVKASALEPALDRFAQFFIAPLFTPEYVDRERKAVHSEYSSKIKDDFRKSFDAYREVVNPEHPASQFSVGSLETLADREGDLVRDDLVEFYKKYYSSDQMVLVVLGKETIEELQAMVLERFKQVPRNNKPVERKPIPMFAPGSLPLQVSTLPEAEGHRLSLSFPMPPTQEHFRKKPLRFIGNLVGHEGEGSLIDVLKQQGWVESLSAGEGFSDRFNGSFQISMQLTDEGLKNKDQIVALAFAEIKQIKKSGLKKWRYKEQGEIADIGFRFLEKQSPSGTVSFIAGRLQDTPPEYALRAGTLFEKFDKKLIKDYLSYLTPENLFLHLSSKTVETDKVSFYYQTHYSVDSLSGKSWPLDKKLAKQLKLPAKNQFVPENLRLIAQNPSRAKPELIEQKNIDLWFKNDIDFNVPRGVTYVRFLLPQVSKDVKNSVMLDLLAAMVEESLQTFSYPASLAGLYYGINNNSRGFDIRISGYSDKQLVLLSEITEELNDYGSYSNQFDAVKNRLVREWSNVEKQTPYLQIFADISSALFSPKWEVKDKLAALKEITSDDLNQFSKVLFDNGKAEIFVHGNFNEGSAKDIAELVNTELLAKQSGSDLVLAPAKVVKLTDKERWKWISVQHPDNALVGYLQGKSDTLEDQAKMMLLEQTMDSGFYNRLRTEQQLGYIVAVTSLNLKETPSVAFVVQSPNTSVMDIRTAMFDYFSTFDPSENLDQNKQALIARLLEAPKNLFERSDVYWSNIGHDNVDFDRQEQLAKLVESISSEDFSAFAKSMLEEGNWLWYAAAEESEMPEGIKPIKNVQQFKQASESYLYP